MFLTFHAIFEQFHSLKNGWNINMKFCHKNGSVRLVDWICSSVLFLFPSATRFFSFRLYEQGLGLMKKPLI